MNAQTIKKAKNAKFLSLGYGVLAYFETLSTLVQIFFVMTLLNIPIMMIYSSYESKIGVSSLKKFTLGNLGQSQSICIIAKVGINRALVECSTGVIT